MSDAILPQPPGLLISKIKRTPMWSTRVQSTPSGREWRTRPMSFARYRLTLQYEFLRSAAAYQEAQQLLGFFNARAGSYDSFLFSDPDDRAVTAQPFGVGDGVSKQWQLVRTLGGAVEPVYALDGAAQIYRGGALVTSGVTVTDTGAVTFSTAPAAGVGLTWTGAYYWRVRFESDELELEKFLADFWRTQQIKLITVKP